MCDLSLHVLTTHPFWLNPVLICQTEDIEVFVFPTVPKWLTLSSGCVLALLRWMSSFHCSLFPHLKVGGASSSTLTLIGYCFPFSVWFPSWCIGNTGLLKLFQQPWIIWMKCSTDMYKKSSFFILYKITWTLHDTVRYFAMIMQWKCIKIGSRQARHVNMIELFLDCISELSTASFCSLPPPHELVLDIQTLCLPFVYYSYKANFDYCHLYQLSGEEMVTEFSQVLGW